MALRGSLVYLLFLFSGDYTKARLIPKALLRLGENLKLKANFIMKVEDREILTNRLQTFETEWGEAERALLLLQTNGMFIPNLCHTKKKPKDEEILTLGLCLKYNSKPFGQPMTQLPSRCGGI